MTLYTYAVIYQGKKAEKDQPEEKAEILISPTNILAKDEKEVGIRAGRALDDKWLDKLDRVSILVRPF